MRAPAFALQRNPRPTSRTTLHRAESSHPPTSAFILSAACGLTCASATGRSSRSSPIWAAPRCCRSPRERAPVAAKRGGCLVTDPGSGGLSYVTGAVRTLWRMLGPSRVRRLGPRIRPTSRSATVRGGCATGTSRAQPYPVWRRTMRGFTQRCRTSRRYLSCRTAIGEQCPRGLRRAATAPGHDGRHPVEQLEQSDVVSSCRVQRSGERAGHVGRSGVTSVRVGDRERGRPPWRRTRRLFHSPT
jgi:hypothetical protein